MAKTIKTALPKITKEDIAKDFEIDIRWVPLKGAWFWRAMDNKKNQPYHGYLETEHFGADAEQATLNTHVIAKLTKMDRILKSAGHSDEGMPKPAKPIAEPNLKELREEQEYNDEVAMQEWIQSQLRKEDTAEED